MATTAVYMMIPYLKSLVYIESQPDGVAAEEDNHDGEQEDGHGVVSAVTL